ncbi:MAG: 3-hydroxybutyryl-CoA dehydrogenase [Candidatus Hydrothermae bacterium]|nr:3-hydroxybutyryl-CoA dehydrogenase [Candidatus Hydrothermae bacterium]
MSEIRKVGVIGAGTMGNGIAHVFAQYGYEVVLVDVAQDMLEHALATIRKNMDRQVRKGVLTEAERDQALARITTTTELDGVRDVDFAVEAVVEQREVKRDLFQKLDQLTRSDVILASNTSSISITALGAVTNRPEKVVGMHFMNPVPVMKLVEVVRGQLTEETTVDTVVRLSEALGKVPAVVNDYPGFVANRILMPMINEACYALMEGVADRDAIDTVMKLGANHPMGPLALADLIGLDVVLFILEVLHRDLGDPKFRPCPLLRRMVAAGLLGRKTGRGFYTYES